MITKKFGTPLVSFSDKVLLLALRIPPGRVTTYGALARAAGAGPLASQSITTILGKAWQRGEKHIPFHRIVYAGGRVWMDATHRKERLMLYRREHIVLDDHDRIVNFEEVVLDPDELRALPC